MNCMLWKNRNVYQLDFSLFSEVKIEGCQQMLHMPILDVTMVPFDCAVVYRPRPETLRLSTLCAV